jgi:hypothetical protein
MNDPLEKCLTKRLPHEMVDHIKLFTGDAMWLNGKFVKITKIAKDDFRYAMLKKMPKIKQLPDEYFQYPHRSKRGCVWFKLKNGKFVTITVRYKRVGQSFAFYWEFQYNQTCIDKFIGTR